MKGAVLLLVAELKGEPARFQASAAKWIRSKLAFLLLLLLMLLLLRMRVKIMMTIFLLFMIQIRENYS
jgi:hypothetical protein